MAWTRKDIKELFFSSIIWNPRGFYPEEYDELAQHLNAGWVVVETQGYVVPPPPAEDSPWYRWYLRLMREGSQSDAHKELKWAALNWVVAQGDTMPDEEYRADFGRPDVVGRQLRLVAECGDTPPSKVVAALMGGWNAFTLWPFDKQTAFIFRLSDEGRKELTTLFQRRLFANNVAGMVGL